MRRLQVVAAGTLILSALIFAHGQSPTPSPQTGATLTRIEQSRPVKSKRVLVKGLPKKMVGIVLDKGVFRLQPGYKWIPQSDNTIAVGLKVGGGVSGSFDCICSKEGEGSCSVQTVGTTMSCAKTKANPCGGDCMLRTTINGSLTRLAIY